MTEMTERNFGWGFGMVGGILFAIGAIVALVVGTVALAVGHPASAYGNVATALVLFVLAGVTLLFASLARKSWSGHPLTPPIVLAAVGVIGWLTVGLSDVIALVGSVLVVLAGLLLLVPPAVHGVKTLATA